MSKEKTEEIQDKKVNKKPKEVLEETPETPVDVEEKEDNGDDSSLENGQEENDLTSQLTETKDKYIRLYSEFENFRRRTAKEKLEMISTANESLLQDLLPIIDDFNRAKNSAQENKHVKSVEQGFVLIESKFRKILDQYGVKPMGVKQGDKFDTEFHEAITHIPAPKKKLKGKIVDIIEEGYLLGEKVLRFAKVVIGK